MLCKTIYTMVQDIVWEHTSPCGTACTFCLYLDAFHTSILCIAAVCTQSQREKQADCTVYGWLPEGMGKQPKQFMSSWMSPSEFFWNWMSHWAMTYMASGVPWVLQWQEACLGTCGALHPKAHTQLAPFCRKEKEKFMLFSNHNGSLLRQQPGAGSFLHHNVLKLFFCCNGWSTQEAVA